VGLCLWLIQRNRGKVYYEVFESDPFPNEGGIAKYFLILLENAGNVPLQAISFEIRFSSGRVQYHTTSDRNIKCVETAGEQELSGCVPILNPRDRFQITLTGTSDISSPQVTARCIGATAKPKTAASAFLDSSGSYFFAISTALITLTVATAWWSGRQQERLVASSETTQKLVQDTTKRLLDLPSGSQRQQELEEQLKNTREANERADKELAAIKKEREVQELHFKQGEPTSEEVIFAIMNRSGLGHLVPELIMSGDHPEYWKTGLFLMHSFLKDEANADKYVSALTGIMSSADEMAPSSYGLLAYLAGKIEQKRGRNDQAIEFFQRCKIKAPLMYEHLMTQDPAYDLISLQKQLLKDNTGSKK
jgi:hypothetical protein